MTEHNYYQLYLDALLLDDDFEGIDIPAEPLPGEEPEETMVRWLVEQGILVWNEEGDGFYIDEERAKAFDPNLYRLLDAMQQAEVDTVLSELEAQGLIYSSVNENGEMVWGLTEEAKENAQIEWREDTA